MNVRMKSAVFVIKDFLSAYKKTVICFSVLFVVGIIVGIVSAVNSVGGVFEKLSRNDMTFGAVKVFFFSSLFVVAGYGVVVISACIRGMSFLAVVPFAVLGFMTGNYLCVLVGVYGGVGIMNLIFVYTPFFLTTFLCLMIGGSIALGHSGKCDSKDKLLKPAVAVLLKALCVNIIISAVIFLLIGAVTKVVVIGG